MQAKGLRQTLIIVISALAILGYTGLITSEQAKMQGLREFLLKPLRQEELAEAVRNVLDGGRQVKAI